MFNKKNILIFIFVLSFTLRTVYMLVPQANYFKDILPINFNAQKQTSDDRTYTKLAYGVLEKGYPAENGKFSSYAGFLYPYIVSVNLAYSNNYIYLFFFQIILDSFTAALIILITLHISGNLKFAFIAGLLYALYYPNFIFPARVLTECIFTFILILSIYIIMIAFEKNDIKYFILFGILMSLAALTKSMIYYVFFILFIYLLYSAFIKKSITKKVIFVLIAFFILQIPSIYFNYITSGRLSGGGASNGWYMILTGTYLPMEGDELKDEDYINYPEHPAGKIYKLSEQNNWNEFQRDSAFKKAATEQLKDNFANHPITSIKVMLIQLSRYWFNMPYYIRFNPRYGTILQAIYKFLLTLLMLAGIYFSFKYIKKQIVYFLFILLFFYSALHSIVFSSLRYSAPLIPIMIIFSTIGLMYIINRNRTIRQNKTSVPDHM